MGAIAVILAGGYGKRLRPLTEDKPKPLVEIAGKPILEWQIEWLKNYDFDTFYILAGYKREKIMEWVTENQDRLDVDIAVLVEKEPLGTAGALKRAIKFVGENSFAVLNGDIITNLDITKLFKDLSLVSIALVPLRSPYGVVQIDENGKIMKFEEKPVLKEYWINAGVYAMDYLVDKYLPDKGMLETDVFPKMISDRLFEGDVTGVKFDNVYWRSIDTIKDVEEATKELEKNPIL